MTLFLLVPSQLYGVDSIDGDVVWQSFLPEAGIFHTTNKYLLFQLRSAVHYPLPPLAVLLAQSKVTTNCVDFVFDSLLLTSFEF